MIKIKIKFFAKLKEDIGHQSLSISLENPKKVIDVVKIISKDFGVNIINRNNYLYAKNLEYCSMDTILDDNDELAIIPPVSGGSIDYDKNSNFNVEITKEKINLNDFIEDKFSSKDGSEVIFLGITRDHNLGREVDKLFYESYSDMASKEIYKIIDTIKSKWNISSLRIIHRLGTVYPSEISMVLIVTSSHRKESFEAAEFFVDELKKSVPIWKKEFFQDGTVWINDKIVE
ncbi:MAG: hypothetical protein EGP06_00185 [SAR202 cluster bacterium]|jgi:molybdopterin synthase catalytic subunit|nr:MAG: hypothetical protein EGP09_03425 [SAR202 cluster bacterium]KAA1300284.1 MAG: hypothetical protein EGP06_00185 [SAR202 cluster bacterium]|tara:strand:+ start:1168 stop:1860 length:693 start_codon:yes stop_codon:yes gene_type:complete